MLTGKTTVQMKRRSDFVCTVLFASLVSKKKFSKISTNLWNLHKIDMALSPHLCHRKLIDFTFSHCLFFCQSQILSLFLSLSLVLLYLSWDENHLKRSLFIISSHNACQLSGPFDAHRSKSFWANEERPTLAVSRRWRSNECGSLTAAWSLDR